MKWEYKVQTAPHVELNEVGEQGWELVSVVVINEKIKFYFKRQING